MKKQIITGLFAALAVVTSAQSFTEWRNPEVNAVNRAPMHTNYLLMNRKRLPVQEPKNTLPVS